MYIRPFGIQLYRLAEIRAAQLRRLAILRHQYTRRDETPLRRDARPIPSSESPPNGA